MQPNIAKPCDPVQKTTSKVDPDSPSMIENKTETTEIEQSHGAKIQVQVQNYADTSIIPLANFVVQP